MKRFVRTHKYVQAIICRDNFVFVPLPNLFLYWIWEPSMRISSVIICSLYTWSAVSVPCTHPEKMVLWMKGASNTLLFNNSEEWSDGEGAGRGPSHLYVSEGCWGGRGLGTCPLGSGPEWRVATEGAMWPGPRHRGWLLNALGSVDLPQTSSLLWCRVPALSTGGPALDHLGMYPATAQRPLPGTE